MKIKESILLFDGVCNLCNSWVQFVIKRNAKKTVKMAALQSPEGEELLKKFEIDKGYIDSLVLIKNDKLYTHSDAALELCKQLDGAWKIFSVLKILPKSFRNMVYNWIAKNRYKWFGKKDVCMIPSTENKSWFL